MGPGSGTSGLTQAEVDSRRAAGQTNHVSNVGSRSAVDIIRSNTFTLFNLILGIAFGLVLLTGRWPDAAFGVVVVVNSGLGIVTEFRAKRILDRLKILQAPTVLVRRDGGEREVVLADIVLDDVARIRSGDQIPADGEVLAAAGLEVDESLLTGESHPVRKQVGDELFSGSAVVAGTATYRVTRVGVDGYANRLTAEAKKYSVVQSDLRDGVNKVLRYVSYAIIPISLLLAWSQLRATGGLATIMEGDNWREAIVAAVAGVIGMIPEGLVLLTSLNFTVAALLLARQKVLIQELPAVEVLARVDVLCLDKTGTVTDGSVALRRLTEVSRLPGAHEALAALTGGPDANATSAAIHAGLEVRPAPIVESTPFSSARKWSAIRTPDAAWILGAPEILLGQRRDEAAVAARAMVGSAAAEGARVLLFGRTTSLLGGDSAVPDDVEPVLIAVLGEGVRPEAPDTIAYFQAEGVQVKIISGDNTDTVASIASSIGLARDGAEPTRFDARELPADREDLREVVLNHDVFGRATPEQKVTIVQTLQRAGHVVAMTGDGVNDAPALKRADLGIAMGSGTGATRAVARIVLVEGNFATLPGVVGQGRRVMANMERVATLFLSKTTYSAFIALVVVLLAWPYPLLPRHVTLVGTLTIGVPAFILALAPNTARFVPGFLTRVLSFAVPVGLVIGVATLVAFLGEAGKEDLIDARTSATLVFLAVGLWVVGVVARPLRTWKVVMLVALGAAGVLVALVPELAEVFELGVPVINLSLLIAIAGGCAGVELVHRFLTPWLLAKERARRTLARRAQAGLAARSARQEHLEKL